MEKTRKTTGVGSFFRWFLLVFVLTAFCNLWGSSAKAADFMAWKDLEYSKIVTYATITLKEEAKVKVTLQNSAANSQIWLRQGDTDETRYASLQVDGTEDSWGSASTTIYLSAGTYDIRAKAIGFSLAYGGMNGRIRVKVEAESLKATNTEPNDTMEQAMALPLGMQVSGALTKNDLYDFYKVTIGKGFINMAITIDSSKYIQIYNSMGMRMKEYYHSGIGASEALPLTWTLTTEELEAGTYYIAVIAGSVGKYKLLVAGFDGDFSKSCSISLSNKAYTYDGKAKTPDVTVVKNGKTLKKGTDYTVTYTNNTNAGTAKVVVNGIGDYTGTASSTFTIAKRSLESSWFTLYYTECSQTGKARKPGLKYNGGLNSGKDYKVTYKNNVYTGTATATIQGIGNYTGTVKKTYIIKPKKEVLSSLNNIRTRKIVIKWKKDSRVSGYQLQYAANRNFNYSRTANMSKNSTSATLRYANKGTRYYFRVRGYKTIGGKKYYGAWSSSKSCKVVR